MESFAGPARLGIERERGLECGERFEREAKAVAALNHPNSVTVHTIEEAEGVRFLTMEVVEGSSLDKLIPPDGLDLARFFRIAIPLAGAVAAAHDNGITHRDLKPAGRTLSATRRSRVVSSARWTAPIAPSPSLESTR